MIAATTPVFSSNHSLTRRKTLIITNAEEKNTKAFMRHLRNAISHRRIKEKVDDQNEIISITFKDQYKKIYKFEIELSVKEIRDIIDLIDKDINLLEEKPNADIC